MRILRWYWNTARLFWQSDDRFEAEFGFVVGLFVPISLIGGIFFAVSEWRSTGDFMFSVVSGLVLAGFLLGMVALLAGFRNGGERIKAWYVKRVDSKDASNDSAAMLAEGWHRIDLNGRPGSQLSVSVWDHSEGRWQSGNITARLDTHKKLFRSPRQVLWISLDINGTPAVENSISTWFTADRADDGSPVFDVYSEQWDIDSGGFDELFRRWIAVPNIESLEPVMKYNPKRSKERGPNSYQATTHLPLDPPPAGAPAV